MTTDYFELAQKLARDASHANDITFWYERIRVLAKGALYALEHPDLPPDPLLIEQLKEALEVTQ